MMTFFPFTLASCTARTVFLYISAYSNSTMADVSGGRYVRIPVGVWDILPNFLYPTYRLSEAGFLFTPTMLVSSEPQLVSQHPFVTLLLRTRLTRPSFAATMYAMGRLVMVSHLYLLFIWLVITNTGRSTRYLIRIRY